MNTFYISVFPSSLPCYFSLSGRNVAYYSGFLFFTTLLGNMDSFAYFKAGKKCAWLWTCWDLAKKQPDAMEKQISLLLYSSRHIYIKKNQNTKLSGNLIKIGTSGILVERLDFWRMTSFLPFLRWCNGHTTNGFEQQKQMWLKSHKIKLFPGE